MKEGEERPTKSVPKTSKVLPTPALSKGALSAPALTKGALSTPALAHLARRGCTGPRASPPPCQVWDKVNSAKPLWMRSPKEVSKEELGLGLVKP